MVKKPHPPEAANLVAEAYKERFGGDLPAEALSGHAAKHLCGNMDKAAQQLLGKGLEL